MSKSVLLLFSSKAFIVSSLSFRSLIHFRLTFVHGVRECSAFIFYTLLSSRNHSLRGLSLLLFFFIFLSPPLCRLELGGFSRALPSFWSLLRTGQLLPGRVSFAVCLPLSDFDLGAVLIPGLLRLGPQAQGRQHGPCLSHGTPGASAAEVSRCLVHDE